jgi:hypothetical protein
MQIEICANHPTRDLIQIEICINTLSSCYADSSLYKLPHRAIRTDSCLDIRPPTGVIQITSEFLDQNTEAILGAF